MNDIDRKECFGVIFQILDLAFERLNKDAGFVFAIGIVFALFGASRLFIAVDKCMTIIYRLPERTFLRQNMLAIGMIFLFIILIPIMIAASSAPTALLSIIPGGGGSVGTYFAGMIFSLLTAFVFFLSIYWFVPNKKMSFKTTWCGSLVAAVTMELFIILFPLYVRNFMGNYAGLLERIEAIFDRYLLFPIGSVGFAVIFLIFLFYFATILILGAQINAFFFENYRPLASGLGTYLSQMYAEHGAGDPSRPLMGDETDALQPSPTTTTSTAQAPQRNVWLNKLWPSKITSTNEQDENVA